MNTSILLCIILGFVFGTILGSFGGVLLDRWENLKSMLTGRSKCMDCQHELSARDLIPLISYLSTKGRCRYCGAPIPIFCPILEVVTGIVFALTTWWIMSSGMSYPVLSTIAWCLINRTMILMLVHDHRTQYLHIEAWIIGMVVAITYSIFWSNGLVFASLWSAGILGGIFLLIYLGGYLVHRIKYGSRQPGFGFGDVLVALLLGRIAPLALGQNILYLIGGEGGILVLIQLFLGYLVACSTIGILYRWYLRSHGNQEVEIAFIPGMLVGFRIYIICVVQFGLFI